VIKIILSIIFLSLTGIVAFFVFLHYILSKIFYLPHVSSKHTPSEYELEHKHEFIRTTHHRKVEIWDINPDVRGPVLIAVHGWANTSDSFLAFAKNMAKKRRIILLNTRNHGASADEKYMTLVKYSEDIKSVVNHLEHQSEKIEPIIIMGHSLGGAAALFCASKDSRISAVITVGAFADLETMMRVGFIQNKLPTNLVGSMLTYIEFRIGEKMVTISPLNTAQSFKGPILLVHGTKDEVVPFSDFNKISKAAHRENVEQLVMKGFGHSELLVEQELADSIESFIIKNIQG